MLERSLPIQNEDDGLVQVGHPIGVKRLPPVLPALRSLDCDMSPRYDALMKPSEALAIHRERIRAIVAHYGGVNPRVFGSVARGEDTEDSDLDILVDDPKDHRLNLFALGGMNYDISSLIGRPVDVVPAADLPQRMRNEAYSDAVPL